MNLVKTIFILIGNLMVLSLALITATPRQTIEDVLWNVTEESSRYIFGEKFDSTQFNTLRFEMTKTSTTPWLAFELPQGFVAKNDCGGIAEHPLSVGMIYLNIEATIRIYAERIGTKFTVEHNASLYEIAPRLIAKFLMDNVKPEGTTLYEANVMSTSQAVEAAQALIAKSPTTTGAVNVDATITGLNDATKRTSVPDAVPTETLVQTSSVANTTIEHELGVDRNLAKKAVEEGVPAIAGV